jgi:endonuclease/exonuclease/phosphatase (EEP) superfamily protein YafD
MTNERLRRIARRVAFGYVAWMVIWFGLWLSVRDAWWWLALLNRIVPHMFAPAPLVVLTAIASRERRLIIVSIAPPLIFAALFGPYVIPQPARSSGDASLRVMTFNVLFSNTDYDAVAEIILRHRPDLIGLQEVQPEMMAALRERLAEEYPYSLLGDEHPYGTTAAFSRYPVIDAHVLDLRADRPAVVMTVEVNGKAVTFISAHLLAYGLEFIPLPEFPTTVSRRVFEQERQARLLVDETNKHGNPVILACDCNSKETSGAYRILAEALTNAARAVGWVVAPPSIAGAMRDTDWQHIDYVFYRGSLTAVEVNVIQANGGSDHFPLVATLDGSSLDLSGLEDLTGLKRLIR